MQAFCHQCIKVAFSGRHYCHILKALLTTVSFIKNENNIFIFYHLANHLPSHFTSGLQCHLFCYVEPYNLGDTHWDYSIIVIHTDSPIKKQTLKNIIMHEITQKADTVKLEISANFISLNLLMRLLYYFTKIK